MSKYDEDQLFTHCPEKMIIYVNVYILINSLRVKFLNICYVGTSLVKFVIRGFFFYRCISGWDYLLIREIVLRLDHTRRKGGKSKAGNESFIYPCDASGSYKKLFDL